MANNDVYDALFAAMVNPKENVFLVHVVSGFAM
jgi:hypothetical protein